MTVVECDMSNRWLSWFAFGSSLVHILFSERLSCIKLICFFSLPSRKNPQIRPRPLPYFPSRLITCVPPWRPQGISVSSFYPWKPSFNLQRPHLGDRFPHHQSIYVLVSTLYVWVHERQTVTQVMSLLASYWLFIPARDGNESHPTGGRVENKRTTPP
jgi:hypothetical protein